VLSVIELFEESSHFPKSVIVVIFAWLVHIVAKM